MCEIPSNIILAQESLEIFDDLFFSSNDFTQLIMGVDREIEIVSPLFDERNEAVKKRMPMALADEKERNEKVGICRHAPSDYPEFMKFLVYIGIDRISLGTDQSVKTKMQISKFKKSWI